MNSMDQRESNMCQLESGHGLGFSDSDTCAADFGPDPEPMIQGRVAGQRFSLLVKGRAAGQRPGLCLSVAITGRRLA